MQKTKLGLSVGLVGAAIFFFGLVGGYVVTALLVGYVLLFEENEWLKKSAVKSVALMLCFSLLSTLIYLLPNLVGFVDNVVSIFGGYFSVNFIYNLANALTSALDIIEKILFVCLGIKAFNQGTIAVPFVDKLIEKYME